MNRICMPATDQDIAAHAGAEHCHALAADDLRHVQVCGLLVVQRELISGLLI